LPIRVDGDVQTLVNRTKTGWVVMIVNNKGITKEPHVDRKPVIDASAVQTVGIFFRGRPVTASNLMDGSPLPMERTGVADERVLRFDLQPGQIQLVAINE
jgi:hypothetical protein